MTNWAGMAIAAFVTLFIPIWVIGWTMIPFHLKIIFTSVGLAVVWYAVNYGGFKGVSGRKGW